MIDLIGTIIDILAGALILLGFFVLLISPLVIIFAYFYRGWKKKDKRSKTVLVVSLLTPVAGFALVFIAFMMIFIANYIVSGIFGY